MRWLGNALASSVGKKTVMGLTGLLLVGFLLEHLYGNLGLMPPFGDDHGERFTEYRDGLHSFGIWLNFAEVGLAALFLCHAYLGIRLSLENREARKQGYAVRNDRGAKTFGSGSMFITGALLLGYLIKHITDFRLNDEYQEAPFETIAATLSQPGNALIYVVAMLVLALHLSHGFQSAFQSLGFNHPRWTPILRVTGYALALAFAGGFALIPLYYLLVWSGGTH